MGKARSIRKNKRRFSGNIHTRRGIVTDQTADDEEDVRAENTNTDQALDEQTQTPVAGK